MPAEHPTFADFVEMVRSGTGIYSDAVQDIEISEYLNEAITFILSSSVENLESLFVLGTATFTFTGGIGSADISAAGKYIARISQCLSPVPARVTFEPYLSGKQISAFPRGAIPDGTALGFEYYALPAVSSPGVWAENSRTYSSPLGISAVLLPVVRWYVERRMSGDSATALMPQLRELVARAVS